MTEFLFADDYDFNNPRGVFVRAKNEAEECRYPRVGENVILFTAEDCEAFGIVVTVTEVREVDNSYVFRTDYPERTWRKRGAQESAEGSTDSSPVP